MKGVIYVEWDDTARPPKARYFGYGTIDGRRVRVHGDIDHSSEFRRVKLTVIERQDETIEQGSEQRHE